ncbi:MAG: rhodanese-like domain-containing protein [Bacteroidota bacterium]
MSGQLPDPDEPFLRIDVDRARELIAAGSQLVDVREPDEYAAGHIPGARLVPLNALLARPREHLRADDVVFVCAVGVRSALACEMAAAIGLTRIYNLEGGTEAWVSSGYPVEKTEK